MKTRLISFLAFGMIATTAAFAGTWNAATNFNSTANSNASSVFSYGSGSPGGTFTPLFVGPPSTPGSPAEWLRSSSNFCCSTADITWNGTGSQLDFFTVRQPTNEVRVDPQASAGVIVRFTAPESADYIFSGLFQSIDIFQGGINWAVYSGAASSTLTSGTLADNSFGSTSPFSISSSLTAGDTMDFVVTTQSNGCCNRSVGLDLSISSNGTDPGPTPTPEPATSGLVLLGLAGLVKGRKKLTRRP